MSHSLSIIPLQILLKFIKMFQTILYNQYLKKFPTYEL